jgi:hypothetical protein
MKSFQSSDLFCKVKEQFLKGLRSDQAATLYHGGGKGQFILIKKIHQFSGKILMPEQHGKEDRLDKGDLSGSCEVRLRIFEELFTVTEQMIDRRKK